MTDDEDSGPRMQPASAVAQRCLALLAVLERCKGMDADLRSWTEDHKIVDYFSPNERDFFYSLNPTEQELVVFTWRSEALIVLLWALGCVPEMPPLNEQVDLSQYLVVQQAAADPATFVSSAVLRESEEIEEAESFLYNQHWRVRDAQLFGRAMPEELDPDIVYERRYGLSWCVGRGDDWDDVPTDT